MNKKGIERMAKGWKTVYTNITTGSKSDFKAFDKAIRNTQSLSTYELKKQSIELYEKKIAEEDKLIAAVEAGRATKPEQIERVKAIKAAREKAKAKTEKKAKAKTAKKEKAKTAKKEKVTASVAD